MVSKDRGGTGISLLFSILHNQTIMEDLTEDQEDKRLQWLNEHSVTEDDVMEDEGGEYIMDEPSIMDEGEPEDYRMKKYYLPEDIQHK